MADKPATSSAVPGVNPVPVKIGGESILDRILPHMKKILVAIGVTSVVLTVIFARKWWIDRGEQKETLKLAAVLQAWGEKVRPKGDTLDPKNPSYETTEERANAVLATAAQQGVDLAPAYLGGMLMDAGKVDDAIAAYKQGIGLPEPDGVLSREGLGIALEQKATAEKDSAARNRGLEEALNAFEAMQPDPEGPRYAYGQYHIGRILSLLGKTGEARAAFTKAKEAAKGSPDLLPRLIDKRLQTLGAT
jgi:tetratricopeptide (TPR) repeat protein